MVHENPQQIRRDLAERLNVHHTTVLIYLKKFYMVSRGDVWVLYKLNERNLMDRGATHCMHDFNKHTEMNTL